MLEQKIKKYLLAPLAALSLTACETQPSLSKIEEEDSSSQQKGSDYQNTYTRTDTSSAKDMKQSQSSQNNMQQTDPDLSTMNKHGYNYGYSKTYAGASGSNSCPPHSCYSYKGPVQTALFAVGLAPYIIRNSQGQNAATQERVKQDFQALNNAFESSPLKLSFIEGKKIQYLTSDKYWNLSLNDLDELIQSKQDGHYLPIYYVNKIETENYTGVTHIGTFGKSTGVVLKGNNWDSSGTVNHEFGHLFGLYHTFEDKSICKDSSCSSDCSSTGDFICDTPYDGKCYSSTCSSCSDDICKPDVSNYMSYSGCKSHFSLQQWKTMGCFLREIVKK